MRSSSIHLIIALGVCGVALAGYGAWYAVIAAKSAAVADLQNQIVAKTETASRIAAARSALAEIAGDETAVRSYFVPESGAAAFINDLEARGRAQGSAVTMLSVSTGNTGARPTLMLSLAIKGAFDAVMRTVGAIEYAPYALSISAFSLAQDAKNSWHANLTLLVGSVPASTATSTP